MPDYFDDFGRDQFIRRDGKRLRVGMIRTIQPGPRETNSQFEYRMETMVDDLAAMSGVLDVSYELEKRSKSYVLCTVYIVHEPRESPIADDATPAGGRFERQRGSSFARA